MRESDDFSIYVKDFRCYVEIIIIVMIVVFSSILKACQGFFKHFRKYLILEALVKWLLENCCYCCCLLRDSHISLIKDPGANLLNHIL